MPFVILLIFYLFPQKCPWHTMVLLDDWIFLVLGGLTNPILYLYLGTRLLQEVLAAQGQTQPTERPINTSPYPAPVSSQPAVTSNTPTKTSPRKSPLPVPRDNVNIKEKPLPTSPTDTRVSWHHKVPIPVTSHSTIPTGETFTQAERTR